MVFLLDIKVNKLHSLLDLESIRKQASLAETSWKSFVGHEYLNFFSVPICSEFRCYHNPNRTSLLIRSE